MKELFRVRVQYASRQRCCKTHKRPLPFTFFGQIQVKLAANLQWETIRLNFTEFYIYKLHGTQYTPQLETLFTTTLLNIQGVFKKDRTFAIKTIFYSILSTVPFKVVHSTGDTPVPNVSSIVGMLPGTHFLTLSSLIAFS